MEKGQVQDHQVRVAFRIGYLGDGFYGSQYQPDRRTVEGEIVNACLRAGLFSDPHTARLIISGRTDRGVHARQQIVAFSTSLPERATRAFPGQLPPDIWVTDHAVVDGDYSPRYDVQSRTYRYYYEISPMNISAMETVVPRFLGKHDFSCFAKLEPGKSPIRTINQLQVHHETDLCWLEITAQSFLWHMVRCIASALSMVADDQISHKQLEIMLTGTCKNKMKPASPHGLILWEISDQIVWNTIEPLKKSLNFHRDAMTRHLLMATVHNLIRP